MTKMFMKKKNINRIECLLTPPKNKFKQISNHFVRGKIGECES